MLLTRIIIKTVHVLNLFAHTFDRLLRRRPTSAPSIAAAALQVLRSTYRFAGSLPALRSCSHSPGFDHRARSGHGCSLARVDADLLLAGAEVNAILKSVRSSTAPLPCPRPNRTSKRSDALSHASDEAFSSCVPPASVCLLESRRVDECRVPRPAASISSSSSRRAGYRGSGEWHRGEERMRCDARDAVHVRQSRRIRPFAGCLRGRAGVTQRRRARFPGRCQLPRCAGHVFCWYQLARRSCAHVASDAVRYLGMHVLRHVM